MPDYYNANPCPWESQKSKIKKVVIKDGVTNIGTFAFRGCSSLTSVTTPNSITRIGGYAFYGCSGLTSITIPNLVTNIGEATFSGCSGLTSVVIGNSVTSIGDDAFYDCSKLSSITIPNSVKSIGKQAFFSCSGLTSVTIPNSVKSIGDNAFYDCKYLTSVTIPNSVESIGNYAFKGCSSFTSVTIPNSVESIGYNVFIDCSGLTSIKVDKDNPYYDSRDNCNAIIDTQDNTLISACINTIIPNSVESIGQYAFYNCKGLTSISIPNSVTSIEGYAFYGCNGLTSISIPNSVTSIGNWAFYNCYGLTSISIPNSVTSIGNYAFDTCALISISIPNSVTNIGSCAFRWNTKLTSITCEASTPPSCGDNCFYDVKKNIPIYVPASSINAYKIANHWKNFTNIQAIPGTSLTDGTPYTNNSQLNGREVSYTRTFSNTNWQALYIPFSLNYNDWKNDFEVAYINGVRQLDKDDNGTIDETIMDVIKIKSGSTTPNMPYLIKAKTTGEKTFSVNDATLYPAEENSIDCSTTIAKYTFTGTYNTISSATMIANNYYGMGGGELVQSDGSNDLMPYRWYMNVESRNPSYNASNAAKTITINVIDEEGETTTGIRQLQITNDELPVYDLNGRQVNENNLKPGIYVQNGKKFVVK